jgi:cytoskeletal protein RodZ
MSPDLVARGVARLVAAGVIGALALSGCGGSQPKAEDSETATASETPSATASETPSETATGADDAQIAKVATGYLDAVNTRNENEAKKYTCPGRNVDFSTLPPDVSYKVSGPPVVTGDSATITARSSAGKPRTTFIMPLRRSGDGWCLSG